MKENEQPPIEESAGDKKVAEYARRIESGEEKEDVVQGLPEVFKQAIEQKLNRIKDDAEKQNLIRKELGIPEVISTQIQSPEQPVPYQEPTSEQKKKLIGWPASYELAKLAKSRGVDLSLMTREQYAQYAIDNGLKIDDDQLRKAPWGRMGTSVEEVVAMNKEKRSSVDKDLDASFHKFSSEMMQKAGTDNRFLFDGVKVRQGTKDSNSWLFFGINAGATSGAQETYKSYLAVKDLQDLSPDKFQLFMKSLQQNGYNGDIKIFQEMAEQGVTLNDQVVMHGATEADALKALELARTYFGDKLADSSTGKDEIVNGKNLSYSQILAEKIKQAIDSKS